MKKVRILLALLITLGLWGCDGAVGGNETTPSGTTLSQTPSETTAPPETTLPEETAPIYPPVPVIEPEHILLREAVPEYDTAAEHPFVLEQEDKSNGYFSVSYVHVYPRGVLSGKPLRGGLIWVPADAQNEMNRGNQQHVFLPEDGVLRQLQTVRFSKTVEAAGKQYPVLFEYIFHNGLYHLTFVPVSGHPAYPDMDVNFSLSLTEDNAKLLLTIYAETDHGTLPYTGYIDLSTGTVDPLTPAELAWTLPEIFDPALLPESYNMDMTLDNNSLLVYQDYNQRHYYYLDGKTGNIHDLSALSARFFKGCYQIDHRLVFESLPVDGGIYRDFWVLDLETLVFEPILQNVWAGDYIWQNAIVYRDADEITHIYNLLSGEDVAVPDFLDTLQAQGTYVLYKTTDHKIIFYNTLTGTFTHLPVPAEWNIPGGSLSPNGRWFCICYTGDQTAQLFIYDLEQNLVLEIQRTDPNGITLSGAYWSDDSEWILCGNDNQEILLYRFLY